MTRNNNTRFLRLGDLIETVSEKCGSNGAVVSGVDINKQFISTRANLEETDTSKYNLVRPTWFACNLMHIGRDERIPVAYNDSDDNLIVTSAYYVFRVKEEMKDCILDEFLYIFFSSKEVDRLCWFYTDSSVRGNLKESRFSDIMVPVPLMERQREIVDTWQSLRKVKEENEALATPLFQLCQSKIQDLKHSMPPVCISPYIKEINVRNTDMSLSEDDSRGVNTDKEIQQSKRIGEKIDTYKIVNKDDIVFNCNIKLTQTTTKFAVAQYKDNKPCIVSNFYVVMHCDSSHLLPEYLMLWLVRDEFARYVRFISCSSVRDSFGFEDMQNVSIPIPSIEIQQALIKVFNCALEAKRIAGEADKLSRDICPPLMQKVINS